MKKILLVWMVWAMGITLSTAQDANPPGAGHSIEAIKIAYMTKQLGLSTEEAQRFWPVYNKYMDEVKRVRRENRTDELAFEEKVLNVRKQYRGEFGKVFNDEARANKVFQCDKNFGMMMREEWQKRRQMRDAMGGPNGGRPLRGGGRPGGN
ncbi:MAG: hypothetical protein RIR90_1095 [Bacteroidota bacterium]